MVQEDHRCHSLSGNALVQFSGGRADSRHRLDHYEFLPGFKPRCRPSGLQCKRRKGCILLHEYIAATGLGKLRLGSAR